MTDVHKKLITYRKDLDDFFMGVPDNFSSSEYFEEYEKEGFIAPPISSYKKIFYINFVMLNPDLLEIYNTPETAGILWQHVLDIFLKVYKKGKHCDLPPFTVIANLSKRGLTDVIYESNHIAYSPENGFQVATGHGNDF